MGSLEEALRKKQLEYDKLEEDLNTTLDANKASSSSETRLQATVESCEKKISEKKKEWQREEAKRKTLEKQMQFSQMNADKLQKLVPVLEYLKNSKTTKTSKNQELKLVDAQRKEADLMVF